MNDMRDGIAKAIELRAKCERLEARNKVLRDACKHVVKWLGQPELENSDGAHPAFKKALKKCRTAIKEDKSNG